MRHAPCAHCLWYWLLVVPPLNNMAYRINTAMTDIPIPEVEYNTPPNKSMNGQGVVTLYRS